MKEASKRRNHTSRARPGVSEVDGEDAMIRFSPDVLNAMQKLHSLVLGNHDKFDDDAAHILQSLAYGNPVTVPNALVFLGTIAEEATRCVAKTGDDRVADALRDMYQALGDFRSCDTQPLTLLVEPKAKARTRSG
jgi:hypothetical protein